MVGDSLEHDIAGGVAAGYAVYGSAHHPHKSACPTIIVESVSEAAKAILLGTFWEPFTQPPLPMRSCAMVVPRKHACTHDGGHTRQ